MNKTRACTWRYFCFCFLCLGKGDLAWLSACRHPADWPQEHLGGPWKLGCSWSLLIPWPCQVEILEEKESTGESESSETLHFLYVSRGCNSGEVRAGSLLPAAAQGGKKRKSTNLITSREHILHREENVWIKSSSKIICFRAEAGMQSWKLRHLLKTS